MFESTSRFGTPSLFAHLLLETCDLHLLRPDPIDVHGEAVVEVLQLVLLLHPGLAGGGERRRRPLAGLGHRRGVAPRRAGRAGHADGTRDEGLPVEEGARVDLKEST